MSADNMTTEANRTLHRWRFFRAGGFDQVRLESGADLVHLDQLDQKLWVALSCPSRGLEFDQKTLDLIDTDKDGRIRVPEILGAVKWACSALKNPDDLIKSSATLALSAINDQSPEGKPLFASARQILANLGKKDASAISLDDTADTARIFAQTQFNGDGIVPADSATDDATKAIINDIIACLGSETDRSGKPGISQAKLDQFFAEAQAFSDWWKKAEGDGANVSPLGEKTADALGAFKAIKSKVDDYFARCRLAAFDNRALAALNRQESEYLALAAKDMSITASEVTGFPLARVEANRALPLKEGLNPAWTGAVANLQALVIKPLLGEKTSLTADEWATVTAKLAGYDAWLAGKAGACVEKLGLARVREILAGKSKDAIGALLAKDKALEPEANSIAAVDKLLHFSRDLHKLLNNFVAFRDFYCRTDKAVFQAGTLFLDQRSCDLCLRVEDAAKHATMAGLAGTYLAYCDCVRKATGEKLQIVAAITGGDSDNLMIGRNGIFYDRQGRDWDATITKIIDSPISIRQAFWAPYKKLARMLEEQVAKRAAAADTAATAKMQTTATAAANVDQTKPAEVPKPKMDTGTLAAIGLVLTTLLAALGGIFAAFAKLPLWQMPLAIVGILVVVSIPSVILAYIKLRKRNLGPILDANGWAINARARINVPFGGALTDVAALPPGAERSVTDPYADKKGPWPTILVILVILSLAGYLANRRGKLHQWTGGLIGTQVTTTNLVDSVTNAPTK